MSVHEIRTYPELAAFAASAQENFRFIIDEFGFGYPTITDHVDYVKIEYVTLESRSPRCRLEIMADNENAEVLFLTVKFTPIVERPLPSLDPDLFAHLGVVGSELSLNKIMEQRAATEWRVPTPRRTVTEAVEAAAYLAKVVKDNCDDVLRGDFSAYLSDEPPDPSGD